MPMKDAVQAINCLSSLADQTLTMREKATKVAFCRKPNRRKLARSKQFCQFDGILLVVFDFGTSDELNG